MNEKWARRNRPLIEERLIYEPTKSWRFQHTWSYINPQFQAYRVLIEQIWENSFEQMSLGKFKPKQDVVCVWMWRL